MGVDMAAKCILWVKARPDYEPLFSILDSLCLDGELRYWIEPGQTSTGVEILLPMSHNALLCSRRL